VAPGWRRVHLDELPEHPVAGEDFSLHWRPVRVTLGIRAFGTNAYLAGKAGEHVVEPHTEDDQVEVYFVHRGSARFTLDGETFDAPAGTYVYLDDPKVRREALALEDGTTVLSFGGPPNFEPSGWEERWLREAGEDF
jgi:quercetin dioxygenase-like cupin family protein